MDIRAFFALALPGSVARWLADYADTLCQFDKQIEVNWVDAESYHLRLAVFHLRKKAYGQFEPPRLYDHITKLVEDKRYDQHLLVDYQCRTGGS